MLLRCWLEKISIIAFAVSDGSVICVSFKKLLRGASSPATTKEKRLERLVSSRVQSSLCSGWSNSELNMVDFLDTVYHRIQVDSRISRRVILGGKMCPKS